jgi:DnaJ-class molecular chaperone
MNQNFNLPPGVTMKDIDPEMKPCPYCDGTGVYTVMDASGSGEWDSYECKECVGSGEVLK